VNPAQSTVCKQALVPGAARIGLLLNPNNANVDLELDETKIASRALGLQLIVIRASTESDIDAAFGSLVQQGAAAVFTTGDAYFFSRRAQIAALALRYGLPTSSSTREYAEAGVAMSYGANRLDSGRRWGLYVGRVLNGEKPAELPIMQPTKFELVINRQTTRLLGIQVPETLLAQADVVIE
jgi:putative ABC transport system substrate-binding protein